MNKEGLNKNNLLEIENAFNQHWKNKERIKGDGHKPFRRWIEKTKSNIDKEGNIMPIMGHHEYGEFIRRSSQSAPSIDHAWYPMGPSNPPSNGIGRVVDIESHPSDPNRFYALTQSGGIWISDNMCESWYPITQKLGQKGANEIAIHPNDPNIVIVAITNSDDAYAETPGIIKSVDKGVTWELLTIHETICDTIANMENPNDPIIQCTGDTLNSRVSGIYWHSQNPNIMVLSSLNGLFRTEDNGLTWTFDQHIKLSDLIAHPTNLDIVYGYSNFLTNCYVTHDAGVTWNEVPIPIDPSDAWITTAKLAVSQQEPNSVFLATAVSNEHRLYKSTDQGNSYNLVPKFYYNYGNQSWHNWAFTVDPNDAKRLFIGGVPLANSEDGGLSWTRYHCDDDSCIHVDFHYLGYHHGSLYAGNDGGVYRKTGSADWEELNDGLQITQHSRCSVSETDSLIVVAGTQDNGTYKRDYTWKKIFGGDGGDNAIDPTDKNRIYFSSQYGQFYRSTDGGFTREFMIGQTITGTSGSFVTPFAIHPNSPNVLFAGFKKLWKSEDYGVSWSPTSSQALTGSNILDFDVASSNSNVIYALTGGTTRVNKSVDGGVSWVQTTNTQIYVNRIEVDPANENRLWVIGSQDVLESVDGGQNWNSIKWNIPDGIILTTIVYDGDTNDHLYLGTNNGVWFKDDTMNEWVQYSNLLPNVFISELVIAESFDKIRAATYGRGLWESYTVDHHACYDSIYIQSTIGEGIYYASKNITTDGLKVDAKETQLKAGIDINLMPNFEVKKMSTFSALIEECPEVIQVNNLPLEEGVYCESAVELLNVTGRYQVDLTNKESYWFVIDSDNRYKVDILSCNEGVNTSLKLYLGSFCYLTSDEDITDYCSMMNGLDNLAAGITDYKVNDYHAHYLEWSKEEDSPSTTCTSIASSSDDAEEYVDTKYINLTSTDLEMTRENQEQLIGMVFKNVDVPKGATITNAYIQFTTDEQTSEITSLMIKGEATDNAQAFTGNQGNISERTTTNVSVNWMPEAWNLIDENGLNQRTPDMSSIISEIVNRPGYNRQNNMGFIISGNGKRTAASYDKSPPLAPELCITYSAQSPDIFEFEVLISDSIGYYCDLATPVNLGINFGSLYQDGGSFGGSARWYSYVPSNDGSIDIVSCGNGLDTHLLLWEGLCQNKTLLYENSAYCDGVFEGTTTAALYDIPVLANTHYLIEWDSQLDNFYTTFDFIEN